MTRLAGPIRLPLLVLATVLAACSPPTATPPPPTAALPKPPSPAAAAPSPFPSPPPSPSPAARPSRLYGALADANRAFARRDWSTALRLYRQAAEDDRSAATPLPLQAAVGRDLRAYARFRIIVLDTLVGQEDDARATLEQMRQTDANTPFLGLALAFWDAYSMTADPRAACNRVTQLVRADPEPVLRPLKTLGEKPDLAAEDVCRPPDPSR